MYFPYFTPFLEKWKIQEFSKPEFLNLKGRAREWLPDKERQNDENIAKGEVIFKNTQLKRFCARHRSDLVRQKRVFKTCRIGRKRITKSAQKDCYVWLIISHTKYISFSVEEKRKKKLIIYIKKDKKKRKVGKEMRGEQLVNSAEQCPRYITWARQTGKQNGLWKLNANILNIAGVLELSTRV